MSALTVKTFAPTVEVVHVAFYCGCVRTYAANKAFAVRACPKHGDAVASTTVETHRLQAPLLKVA